MERLKAYFRRGPDKLTTIHIVLDALIGALIRKKIIKHEDIQQEILTNSEPKRRDGRE